MRETVSEKGCLCGVTMPSRRRHKDGMLAKSLASHVRGWPAEDFPTRSGSAGECSRKKQEKAKRGTAAAPPLTFAAGSAPCKVKIAAGPDQ